MPKIDLEKYSMKSEEHEPSELSQFKENRDDLSAVGYEIDEKERSGSYFQLDHSVLSSTSGQEGIEISTTTDALKKYDWLRDYWWNAVSPDKDRYTKQVDLKQTQGYFIHLLPGVKAEFPVQSCLLISQENIAQNVHNIIIAEEGSEAHIITGCSTSHGVNNALHLGVSEIYVKKNAKLTSTMIHLWGPEIVVRPRTGIFIEENGTFTSNYVCMNPVKDLQMAPTAYCDKNARATFQTIIYASKDSKMDLGSNVFLKGDGSRAEIISRVIARDNSEVISRGDIIGKGRNVRGHLECRGLMLSNHAKIHAIPELEAETAEADLSHEAAVGRISEEEIEYLTSRGLNEEEAASVIVRGFLNVDIEGLPKELEEEIKKKIEMSAAVM